MEKKSLKIISVRGGLTKLVSLMVVMVLVFGSVSTVNATSYTSKTFTASHDVKVGSTTVATVTQEVTVYFYTDGRVHIYRYGVSCQPKSLLATCSVDTPSITNTNGSFSDAVGNYTVTYFGDTYYLACVATISAGDTAPDLAFL